MTRASLLACAVPPLLIFGSGVSQDPPTHGAMPLPITKTYDVGGVNRLEFSVTWTDTGGEEDLDAGEIVCRNYCNGQKHFAHSTCDTSCDSTCRGLHQRTLDPEWRFIDREPGFREHNSMIDIANAGARFGADVPEASVTYTVATDIQSAFIDPTTKTSKYRLQANFRHFNDKPCAGTIRNMKGRVYDVSVQWKLYRDVDVDGKMIRTNGPSGTTPFGQVLIPENKFTDFHRESCRCNIITEDKEHGLVPGGSGSTGGGTPTSTGAGRSDRRDPSCDGSRRC